MIQLRPITQADIGALGGTSYADAPIEEQRRMITESESQLHEGRYFELFCVIWEGDIVGFISLFAHADHIISCGPEIKPPYRQQGLAYEAEQRILNMAKQRGYTIAVAKVNECNVASRALHEKLGFELDSTVQSRHGHTSLLYLKAL